MLLDLGIDDQMFFWFASGNQTSAIEQEVVLQEEIDETRFKRAVMKSMQTHAVFRTHPVIINGRVKASVEDDIADVPVFLEDNKARKYGTLDTCGYLFYFSLNKNRLVFHGFHGLSDGMSSRDFLITVLNYYFHDVKGILFDKPKCESLDEFCLIRHIIKEYSGNNAVGRFVPDDHADRIFHFPEELFKESERKWHAFEIDVPLTPLLARAKKYGASVLPVFQAMIGNAIRNYYDVGERMIVSYTPVDMRRIFGCETNRNGSFSVSIPYSAMMDGLDFGNRALLLRRILNYQIRPENIRCALESAYDSYVRADSQPYSIEQIVPAIRWMKTNGKKKEPYTYGLSYLGKISLLDQVKPFVDSIKVSVSMSDIPLMIVAGETNGVVRMMAAQLFENDGLIREIYKEISSAISETEFIDCGICTYDRLDLEDLEHII